MTTTIGTDKIDRNWKLPVRFVLGESPTAVIKGKLVTFKDLAEARERAAKEGYKGIVVN